MNTNNLTSQQITEWYDNIQVQIDSLSQYLSTIQESIEFGGGSGGGIMDITKSEDTSLSDSWQNLFLAMEAANKKLQNKAEVFYSSIKTFTEIINQSNEESISSIDETTQSFEEASDAINKL